MLHLATFKLHHIWFRCLQKQIRLEVWYKQVLNLWKLVWREIKTLVVDNVYTTE